MNEGKVSLALVGCGAIAQTHMEAVSRVPGIVLATVHDRELSAAQQAASKYRCGIAENIREICHDPSIDAVLICTPPATHYEIAKTCLAHGKHILCEKPFTVSEAQAREIKRLAVSAKKTVMMASKFRFVPDVMEARRLIQSGVLGDIVLAEIIFCSTVDMSKRWNSNAALSGGGVLIDNGSHAVDLIRYLVGPIASVYAQEGKKTQAIGVEDTARLHFETTENVIGMVDLSWSLYKNAPSYVNIEGTRGTIEIGWRESILWDSKTKISKSFGTGYQKLDAFTSQLAHFADCLQKRTKPILTIDDAVESVRVIELAYKSLRKKRWLAFKKQR